MNSLALPEVLLIAVALSLDALAVAVAAAAAGRAAAPRAGFRLAFHFGLFQALMPVLGWLAGWRLATYIQAFDHWVAAGLLAVVAARMIRTGLDRHEARLPGDPSRGLALIALSTAVSLDALAVGLSLALLHVAVWLPAAIIGLVTGAVTFAGVRLGRSLHARFGRAAEVAGGVVLLLIAARILVIHLS
jgi:manganese efflux pump family protein